MVEPGYTTTEFWGKVVVQLLGVIVLFHLVSFTSDQTQAVIGLSTLVIPEVAYALSRGLRKQGTSALPAAVPPAPATPKGVPVA